MQRLGQFIRARRQAWTMGVPEFERFEHELHAYELAIGRLLCHHRFRQLLAKPCAQFQHLIFDIGQRGRVRLVAAG